MNLISFSSGRHGAGKTTLAAHLAAHAHGRGLRSLLVDATRDKKLTFWHGLRRDLGLPISRARGVETALGLAHRNAHDLVFVDSDTDRCDAALAAATLTIIVVRPAAMDADAVLRAAEAAYAAETPFMVVLNAAPAKRSSDVSPVVRDARRRLEDKGLPVWADQVTQRAIFAMSLAVGATVSEIDDRCAATDEINRLWIMVERVVQACPPRSRDPQTAKAA
jgi:chromosome partitioning protein